MLTFRFYGTEQNHDLAEGPLQRFQRLEKELAELKEDLNRISLSEGGNKENQSTNPTKIDPVELTKLVETLQKRVNSLHLQSIGATGDSNQLDEKAKKYKNFHFV